ncbi:hypothetical protein [Egicoccus halophilus]|uniref:Inner membrane protein n=1 Tax=Egicoccus halophilus TaxID=1670830 RepID=A0A8J3A7B3_9ACTN|nr:hypothetical protein [Egicoccus halophilus]GGI03157.1 hypothetical protein GCM10011354_02810 [Egicoccus halophilus]
MDPALLYELLGYLASALIVVSLLMTSVLRLRVIGLAGAITFTAYGLLIEAYPIAIANGAIVFIHVFHLRRMLRARATDAWFEAVEVSPDSPVLRRFVDFHAEDARRFQPDFPGIRPEQLALLVLRDAVPVGVVLAEVTGHEARVVLDYVTAEHRDLRPGRFVWIESDAFTSRGVRRVTTTAPTDDHARYLDQVGFSRAEDGVWVREG